MLMVYQEKIHLDFSLEDKENNLEVSERIGHLLVL